MNEKLTIDYEPVRPRMPWSRVLARYLKAPGEDSFLGCSALHLAMMGWFFTLLCFIVGMKPMAACMSLPCIALAGIMGFGALFQRHTSKTFALAALALAGVYTLLACIFRLG